MSSFEIPKNFTREEICSIIENALPMVEDPKETINGMLMAAGRFIGFVTKDDPVTNQAIEMMFKCYIKKGREEAQQFK